MHKISASIALLIASLAVLGIPFREGFAQGSKAALQGTIRDKSAAVIPGAKIEVTSLETGQQRITLSSTAGIFSVPDLTPGKYRVVVSMPGFQTSIRENIDLAVGQQMDLNVVLEVGEVTEQVTVMDEAPLVDTSTSQLSGLVGERQIKDLPLNGRSFDNLITLNPGAVNTTAIKGGSSNSTGPGNYFAIGGRRPGENVFMWNGVEYPGGSSAVSSTPGGVSGQLLGIDAVREFNVVASLDSAEYGHRAGGQIGVVTASGTNSLHGSLFEFLRNSDLDARNFFDKGGVPPFKRNQFGGSAGGPIQKDKTFIFGNYEGYRQRLGLSSVAVVPDTQARQGLLPDAQGNYQPVAGFNPAIKPYFALWPEPDANGELLVNGRPSGSALSHSNPPNPIREEFGTIRVDHTFGSVDSLSGVYTIDDGESSTPGQNPISLSNIVLRTQILSLSETRIFSPSVVNTFTAGYSRPRYFLLLPVTVHPAGVDPFVTGYPMGQIRIGGGATAGASLITNAGSGPSTGGLQGDTTNIFSYQDQVHITRGIHSITAGGWLERLQNNEVALSYGQAVFSDLPSFLQGKPSMITVQPRGASLPWRTLLGAWFVQDSMKLRSNLTLSLGLRHELTNGWHNAFGEAANYIPGPDGVLLTQPIIGDSFLTKNNALKLFGPRAGVAWDPFGNGKTSVRAGFGIAYNLLDNIGWCCQATNPKFSTYSITGGSTPAYYPITVAPGGAPSIVGLTVQTSSSGGGGGIQPDAKTPTVINYRVEVQQELGGSTVLRLAYLGSHGYHELIRGDGNLVSPVICSAAARNCPAGLPDGTKYFPAGTTVRRNPNLASFVQIFTSAFNNYNGLVVDLNRRFRGGLAFRASYTYSKTMDNSSSLSSLQAVVNPGLVLDPYDRRRDYSASAFDIRNRFSLNGTYELPFGAGKAFLSGSKGLTEHIVGGWQLNSIVGVQSGFPFTAQLGFSQSRDGNRSTPDRPNMAPGRTLQGIYLNQPTQWFDPTAFQLPVLGTYGNVGRNTLVTPGLVSFDLSLFKTTRLSEKWNLQFRAEFFNLINRTNFGVPSPVVLTTSGAPAPSAGVITNTSTTSRQIQFGLKLTF